MTPESSVISESQKQPEITEEFVKKWMANVDRIPGLFGIQKDGQEVVDAVKKRNRDGSLEPVVVLRIEGSILEVPAAEFLSKGTYARNFLEFISEHGKEVSEQTNGELDNSEFETSPQEERLKTLFAPLKPLENNVQHPGYDFLFNDDPADRKIFDEYSKAYEKTAAKNAEYKKFVTPETIADSQLKLRRALEIDGRLRAIISNYYDLSKTSMLDIVDALRENPEVRLEVGTYLLSKVDSAVSRYSDIMPDRFIHNNQKNPDRSLVTVRNMRSREWVAILCLAKLDGSFNKDLELIGPEFDTNGKPILGQHRAAADIVLSMAA